MADIGGFVNMPYIGLDNLEAELSYFKRFVNNVEIVVDYPAGPHSLSDNDIKNIKALLDSLEFNAVIHAPFSFNFLLSPCKEIFEASLNDIKITSKIATEIDAKLVTVHLGIVSAYQKNSFSGLVSRAIRNLENISQEHGIDIAVENLDFKTGFKWGFPLTTEEMRIVEDTELFVTLDTGHAFMRSVDIGGFLDTFRKKLRNIHIHDSNGEKAHLAIGKGDINFEKIFKKLRDIGYRGPAHIEVLERGDFESSFRALNGLI